MSTIPEMAAWLVEHASGPITQELRDKFDRLFAAEFEHERWQAVGRAGFIIEQRAQAGRRPSR